MKIKNSELDKNHLITWFGRTYQDTKGHHFFYTGSGFEVMFEGSQLTAELYCDVPSKDKKPFIVVMIDDQQAQTIALKQGLNTLELINAVYANYRVRVLKRSESIMSTTILHSIMTDGVFLKSSLHPKLKIEFIGDSLTCGFGNLGLSPEEPFKTDTEDGLNGFAALTAKTLNADYQIVAVSGIGMYKSFYASRNMPSIYDLIDISMDVPYGFSYQPDIVVVALGTNDHHYLSNLEDNSQLREKRGFMETYRQFLHRIRQLNPNAEIYCISHEKRQPHVRQLIEKVVSASSLDDVYHQEIAAPIVDEGMGSQYHPTVTTHIRMAKTLVESIKKHTKYEV